MKVWERWKTTNNRERESSDFDDTCVETSATWRNSTFLRRLVWCSFGLSDYRTEYSTLSCPKQKYTSACERLSTMFFLLSFFIFSFCIYFFGKLQIIQTWFDWNLSYLIWNLTLYSRKNWPKFKLFTYSLKSYGPRIPLDSFYILWSCIFYIFLEERVIKVESNYIFSHIFKESGLRNSNWANFRWVKCQISNYSRQFKF